MPHSILYCGDTALTEAAAYLAGLLHHFGLEFDYVPSDAALTPDVLGTERSLVILSDYPAAMASEPASGIAAELAPLFPDVPPPVLTGAIAGYQASGLWAKQTDLPPAAFVRLKGALLSGGLISRDIPYDHVIARLETS